MAERPTKGLTTRQQMVLDYICESIRDRGYPPTLREIGRRMGIRSTNGVVDHLRALERKGFLERENMKSRALRPTSSASEQLPATPAAPIAPGDPAAFIEIPVVGRVSVGVPLLADAHLIEVLRVERRMLGTSAGREVFGYKVQGDSMIDAGIFSGDILFVRKQLTASRGEVVLVIVGDEATVKYYFPERDHVRFQSANKNMAPIYVRAADFKPTMLLGIACGLYRRI